MAPVEPVTSGRAAADRDGPSSRAPPSSPLKRLAVHASHYSLSGLLTTLAGFVSFPLLTRVFTLAEYGTMGFIGVTVTISVAIGKLGIQQALLRFHSEISASKRPFTLRQLSATVLFGMVSTGVATAILVLASALLAPRGLIGEPRVRVLLAIACISIVVRIVESSALNFARAEQRTKLVVTYEVTKKYLGLALILSALFLVAKDLRAFYSAIAVGEMLAIAGLLYFLFRGRFPAPREFSPPLFREMLQFGIPMMFGYEISGIILAVGDRYAIQWLIGAAPLGLYSAAYTLCECVQAVLITSVGQAVVPLYLQVWDHRGRAEATAFIARSLRTYVLVGAPVIAGLTAVGRELLPAVASAKFAGAAGVLPWVMAGMVVDGASSMTGAGLVIHRKTRQIMAIVMSSAALNILLNVVLVPRIGIIGAAVATLVSYGMSALLFAVAGRNLLKLTFPWATLARAGAASLVMYLSVAFMMPGGGLLSVAVRAAMGASIYVAIMALIDADARTLARGILVKVGLAGSGKLSGKG